MACTRMPAGNERETDMREIMKDESKELGLCLNM